MYPYKQAHYVFCPALFFLISQTLPTSDNPLERIGLANPSIQNLKLVACTFSAYHAVKRSLLIRSLVHETPTLEPELMLSIQGLFAAAFHAEALEVGLAPIRFRPTPDSVFLITNYMQALHNPFLANSTGTGPVCTDCPNP